MTLLTPAQMRFVTTHLGHPRSIEILKAAAAGRSATPPCRPRRPRRPNRGRSARRFYTAAEYAEVRRCYGKMAIAELAGHLHRTESSVYQAAVRIGVTRKLCPRGEDLERFIRGQHSLGWSD